MNHLIDAFIDHLVERDSPAKDATQQAYRTDLTQFVDHVLRAGVESAGAVTQAMVVEYLDGLAGVAQSTRVRKLATLRTWFHYLLTAGHIAADPIWDLRPKRIVTCQRATLTPEQVAAVVGHHPEGSRERAAIELLAVGLQVSEVVDLDCEALNVRDGTLYVSRDRRTVTLIESAVRALTAYITQGRNKPKGRHNALFLNYAGRRISRQSVWTAVRDAGRAIGLPRLGPTDLRWAAGVNMAARGIDAQTIRVHMGHADVNNTMAYVREAKRLRAGGGVAAS